MELTEVLQLLKPNLPSNTIVQRISCQLLWIRTSESAAAVRQPPQHSYSIHKDRNQGEYEVSHVFLFRPVAHITRWS